jgi:hypothetical protein
MKKKEMLEEKFKIDKFYFLYKQKEMLVVVFQKVLQKLHFHMKKERDDKKKRIK